MAEQAAKAADQAAVGIRTADPRHTLQIVAARGKPLADLLDTLKTVPAVPGGVLPIVPIAEVGEKPFEDGVEFIATMRNVLVPRRGRDRDCRTHIIAYERNKLFASDRELVHRSSHNTYKASPGQARIGIPVSDKRRLDREHEVAWCSSGSGLRSTMGSKRPATKHILRVAGRAP